MPPVPFSSGSSLIILSKQFTQFTPPACILLSRGYGTRPGCRSPPHFPIPRLDSITRKHRRNEYPSIHTANLSFLGWIGSFFWLPQDAVKAEDVPFVGDGKNNGLCEFSPHYRASGLLETIVDNPRVYLSEVLKILQERGRGEVELLLRYPKHKYRTFLEDTMSGIYPDSEVRKAPDSSLPLPAPIALYRVEDLDSESKRKVVALRLFIHPTPDVYTSKEALQNMLEAVIIAKRNCGEPRDSSLNEGFSFCIQRGNDLWGGEIRVEDNTFYIPS